MSSRQSPILHPGRETLGSVEGLIEAMNSHGGFVFGLYEPVLASRIECQIEPGLEKQVAESLRKRVYELYEKRVRLSGTLRTNRKGEVRSAKVALIVPLQMEPKFKNAKEVSGIFDITGGIEASEYLDRLRDA